jgi:hypothetical protein
MSELSISPYFPFRRIKIVKQVVDKTVSKAFINVVPDKCFHPVCHICGQKVLSAHSWTQRFIRDLNLDSAQVWIRCDYRIHNGKLEGVNNKIKVIKSKTYGFHDLRYFELKIYQAFFK